MTSQVQLLTESLSQLINQGKVEVPMLPEVANKALLLAQTPDSNAGKMAQLIQSDQSLAGHVMRIANSAAYTPTSNLVSLQQAIARLGMRIISEIALIAALGSKMFNTPSYESYVAGVWQHALATSLWSKEVARHCRSNVEVAFLAGLLHSIGRPAVLQAILELAKQQQLILSEAEVHRLENIFCHQVSIAVVNRWKMPILVLDAVSNYTDDSHNVLGGDHAAHIHVGSQLSHHMLTPEVFEKSAVLGLPALTTLNIYQDEAEDLLDEMDKMKAQLEGLSL